MSEVIAGGSSRVGENIDGEGSSEEGKDIEGVI